jgi:exopolysaccharide biosynthesis polyprenyl glycosylphosphotransferase
MLRRHAAELRALLMLVDGLMAVGLVIVASVIRFGGQWSIHWQELDLVIDPLVLTIGYAVIWVGVLTLNGLYRPRARWTIRSEAVDLLRATAMMAAILLAVLFWIRIPDVSRLFLLLLFPAQWLVALVTRVALRLSFQRLRERGYNRRFMLIVGSGARGQAFARKVESHRELGLEVMGFLDEDASIELPARWRRLGSLEDVEHLLRTLVVDEVAVCLPFSMWDKVDAITRICEDHGKIVRVPMDVLDRAFASGRVEELDGTPVYSLVSGPDRVLGLALKRLIDLAIAAVGLIILSPILAIIAIAIVLMDGHPILFTQVRVGLHGRAFTVYKFRTMTPDAEERFAEVAHLGEGRGPAFKMARDPRMTRSGFFLRRTSLDELPQLWNVLRGEMSLVGPRPAPPREVETYDMWLRRRLSMKPGITGLWQVTARSSNDFDRRAELDLDYIDRWSFWLDLKILLRTIPAAFEGR